MKRWGQTDIGTAIRNRLNEQGIEWMECERIAGLILDDIGNPESIVIRNQYGEAILDVVKEIAE